VFGQDPFAFNFSVSGADIGRHANANEDEGQCDNGTNLPDTSMIIAVMCIHIPNSSFRRTLGLAKK
jgi:hypothetical protein